MPRELPRRLSKVTNVEVPRPTAPDGSEEYVAGLFAAQYKDKLRYVPKWGWAFYDGRKWSLADSRLAAGRCLRPFMVEVAAARNDPTEKKRLCSARTMSSVEQLAMRDSEYLFATEDQWDADPWLLNTPEGVVDPRTGRTRAHRPNDYTTKLTAVSQDSSKPRRWLNFIEEITDSDEELQDYLQRVCGYCVTGCTTEHALFFAYGTGGNGKSVFIETVRYVLGDYAVTASIEAFTHSRYEHHPTELARLRGARLVTATETEEGRRWAEAKIKQLTGGDTITARFMRQDFFEYKPRFKLLIAGNYKPAIRGVDPAMQRRVHIIPFTVTIPRRRMDLKLADKLREEAPAILNWMIEGCMQWQERGLDPPPSVVEATRDYFEAEDIIGHFMRERCVEHAQEQIESSVLYAAWKDWAEARGEFVGSQKFFSSRILAKGFEPVRVSNGRSAFRGLTTKSGKR